ncbi:RNA-binding domain-containing protein [Punctularia strigosozonata HHB-11173 SS5]|uniref:RNA-binding domain-containing protein n=1 Tax=Punctularia strigosozonata (strain HHB-11173) TaxID=741275 RepID=UPI0004416A24|nr:RNA-binding domain-containing protein [Punctularia strigosozonata HHB-11173 SS5]EIN14325.1 RNA-binding domain-containing protein [Punctularia strigosozonata HHB-11173 SS5]
MAPSNNGQSGISIPAGDIGVGNGHAAHSADEQWTNGSGEPRDVPPPRRSSRSRSPGARDDRGRVGAESTNPGNNLHVSGLSYKVDTRDLEAAFAKVGRVQKASVMYDPHTRESRGFGFVTMETAEEADAAIAALGSTELMGKIITVEKARRARARTPTPGRYHGPPKRNENEKPYDPRPYDSRYSRDFDDRRGAPRGRYDEYRGGGGGRYDDYPPRRDYDRGSYNRDYDRGARYDDRRY